ncbi:hypothetical protein HK104_004039 [Borealophlyctis nickersoniae]|nr:hypothetical protein HK104_004039 [Borealophlyctis nickersoniae]
MNTPHQQPHDSIHVGNSDAAYLMHLDKRLHLGMSLTAFILQMPNGRSLPAHVYIILLLLEQRLSEWRQQTKYDYNQSATHLKPILLHEVPLAIVITGIVHELIKSIEIYDAQTRGSRGNRTVMAPSFAALASAFRNCYERVEVVVGTGADVDVPPAYTP